MSAETPTLVKARDDQDRHVMMLLSLFNHRHCRPNSAGAADFTQACARHHHSHLVRTQTPCASLDRLLYIELFSIFCRGQKRTRRDRVTNSAPALAAKSP
jgi:hypothetical protein